MKNMGILLLSLFGVMVILIAGCIGSQAAQPAAAVTPSITATAAITTVPTMTMSARPTICRTQAPGVLECLYTDITRTTVPTTVPRVTETFPTPKEITVTSEGPVAGSISGPLATPVTLTGVGNDIVWFEAVRPGIVTIKMRNGFGSQVVKNCEEKYFRVALAGKSIDSVLYDKGMALSTVIKTATIPLEGRYSLSVKSCGQWEIKIS